MVIDKKHYYDGKPYEILFDRALKEVRNIIVEQIEPGSLVVDIACGTGSLVFDLAEKCKSVTGVELSSKMVEHAKHRQELNGKHNANFVHGDATSLPTFKDKEFDSVLSNQVFEHVFNPNEFLREINRVTKVDGLFLITVPFVWDEHEQPYDYARYSSFGLKHILAENGFEIIEHRKSNNGIEVIFQLINDYLYKVIMTENVYFNLLIIILLMAPINMTGLILSKLLPRNNDLYLDNIVLAKKIKDA